MISDPQKYPDEDFLESEEIKQRLHELYATRPNGK